jgi:hypothetical protein
MALKINVVGTIDSMFEKFVITEPMVPAAAVQIQAAAAGPQSEQAEALDRSLRPVDETLGCIYRLTCIVTGMCYIGQVKLVKYKDEKPYIYGPKGRWSDHVSEAMGGSVKPIHQAIQDYGKDNFIVEVLQVDIITMLDDLEDNYIIQLNTLDPNGYNITLNNVNPFTPGRLDLLAGKYGANIIQQQDGSAMEEVRQRLQAELDDPHIKKWKLIKAKFDDQPIERIRMQMTKKITPPRKDGTRYRYDAVIIYLYNDATSKHVSQLAFGGKTISTQKAYQEALTFAQKIHAIQGVQVEDQVDQTKLSQEIFVEVNR